LKRAAGIESGGAFISHPQKYEHFRRFARSALPRKAGKRRITAKLTEIRGFSVSRRFIFTFVKNPA
jgi:hypothetical protein